MASSELPKDRWMISLLLAALSAVLWFLLLDTRKEVSNIRDNQQVSMTRLATQELKVETLQSENKEMRIELRLLQQQQQQERNQRNGH